MTEYEVITGFVDLTDEKYVYRPGDKYPRTDAPVPTAERLQALTSAKNALKKPLIREISSEPEKPVRRRKRA